MLQESAMSLLLLPLALLSFVYNCKFAHACRGWLGELSATLPGVLVQQLFHDEHKVRRLLFHVHKVIARHAVHLGTLRDAAARACVHLAHIVEDVLFAHETAA